jgi:hypothetical protein
MVLLVADLGAGGSTIGPGLFSCAPQDLLERGFEAPGPFTSPASASTSREIEALERMT